MKHRHNVARGPLRKVLGEVAIRTIYKFNDRDDISFLSRNELLECGHCQRIKQDCFGEYFSTRRRCNQCRESKPVQFNERHMAQFKAGVRKFEDVEEIC